MILKSSVTQLVVYRSKIRSVALLFRCFQFKEKGSTKAKTPLFLGPQPLILLTLFSNSTSRPNMNLILLLI